MPRKTCCVDGCGRPVVARKMCNVHYRRFMKYGDCQKEKPFCIPNKGRICKVDGCENLQKLLGIARCTTLDCKDTMT